MNRSQSDALLVASTTFSRLSAPARGAVAVIRVEGPRAAEIVGQSFRPHGARALAEGGSPALFVGLWHHGEELVVGRLDQATFELNCHGGLAAVDAIVADLRSAGAMELPQREWLAQSSTGSLEAAAWQALVDCTTEQTAALLLDQANGALARALEQLDRELAEGNREAAAAQVDALLLYRAAGRHAIAPIRVVLAGPPNVGKSTLLNALLGYTRAIVSEQAGTTRDAVAVPTAFEGWPIELTDTAGIWAGADALDRTAIERTHERLASADVVLLLFAVDTPWTDEARELIAGFPDALVVYTKADIAPLPRDGRPPGLVTSAEAGVGFDTLITTIIRRAIPDAPPPGAGVPFDVEHIEQLERLAALISAGDLVAARRAGHFRPLTLRTLARCRQQSLLLASCTFRHLLGTKFKYSARNQRTAPRRTMTNIGAIVRPDILRRLAENAATQGAALAATWAVHALGQDDRHGLWRATARAISAAP